MFPKLTFDPIFSGSEELTNSDVTDNDEALHRVRRAGLSMLRLGRGLQMLRLGKRAPHMLRLGRSAGDGLSPEDFQYLLSIMRDNRQVPLPRYGKDLALEYVLMNALKNAEMYGDEEPELGFGYDFDNPERQIRPAPRPGMRYRRSTTDNGPDNSKRVAPFPRFGKELTESEEKLEEDKYLTEKFYQDKYNFEKQIEDDQPRVRVAPLMRYGKDEMSGYESEEEGNDDTVVKRAMRMLRLGRGMRMLRLGKRPSNSEEPSQADKRALRLLRLGKRPFKMLRLGRSNEDKRALRLLRLGKKSDNSES